MIIADFGTSYAKILDTEKGDVKVVKTLELPKGFKADYGTGHNAGLYSKHTVNELVALARGADVILGSPSDYTVLDVGSRDAKYVVKKNGVIRKLAWNPPCGAFTGFGLELLGLYFKLDIGKLKKTNLSFPFTCALLSFGNIFDFIQSGIPLEDAVSSVVKALVLNLYRFAGSPKKIFLSGGMCDNKIFVSYLEDLAEVKLLGRFVLVRGIMSEVTMTGEL